ncbi:hypothetical protein OY11_24510 [Salmonella enterica]|nr:hypothetical protein [Salmonella enterica]
MSPAQRKIIHQALNIIEKKFMSVEESPTICAPSEFIEYLRLKLWDYEREHFAVLFLNAQHKIIAAETLFSGSLSHVEVHPRIIAQYALRHNAAAVILAHNHPGGAAEPSKSDRFITERVVKVLSLLDIRVLDHFILTPSSEYFSFSEHGFL